MARLIRDAEVASLLAAAGGSRGDHTVSPRAMYALLLYNLSLLDEQIDILYDYLGTEDQMVSAMGWSDNQVPDQVRDSWSNLNYLLNARKALTSLLRSFDGRPV
ncbi:MAG: hypothetical protein GXY68_08895 [Chloroflexi bacterium]|jgi:hypothetical protein|nr:hypothetical protein [Chloroflexota bacterium]